MCFGIKPKNSKLIVKLIETVCSENLKYLKKINHIKVLVHFRRLKIRQF